MDKPMLLCGETLHVRNPMVLAVRLPGRGGVTVPGLSVREIVNVSLVDWSALGENHGLDFWSMLPDGTVCAIPSDKR